MKHSEQKYLSGFGNHFETEALPKGLPIGQNNPQKHALGLYTEQLSGAAFTALPHENLRTWLYRILPSAKHPAFEAAPKNCKTWLSHAAESHVTPNQLRWDAFTKKNDLDFVEGIFTMCVAGDAIQQSGSAAHIYAATKSMTNKAFFNADGDLLIVPQSGNLSITTEMGLIDAKPGEVVCIPRGVRFSVGLSKEGSLHSGYICENFGAHFQLPYRGPIGSNGLANHRDFLYPVAAFTESKKAHTLLQKFCGKFFQTELKHSPFDVVAWHGNYAPYKYDLDRFNTIGSISYDHPDPSIFTVLTSPSFRPGVANVDFVIFPPRWMVAEHTFRPPWFHRNIMSEFMGLIHGVYDAKTSGGFVPGGSSLHNCMSAHGPDAGSFETATNADLKPHKIDKTMAFMFESSLVYLPTAQAMQCKELQKDYDACWQDLKSHFKK